MLGHVMKMPASKFTLAVSALALACLFTVPSVYSAEKSSTRSSSQKSSTGVEKSTSKSANKSATAASKAAEKQMREDENLEKYDKNGNGKLDPDERAAMRADQEKSKSKKSPKSKKKKEQP